MPHLLYRRQMGTDERVQYARGGNRAFYRRWIVANGWAEAAGLGTTFLIGRRVAPELESAAGAAVLGVAIVAVILGTFLEGVLVGIAQEHVLRQHVRRLRRGSWTVATAAGAGLAWILGMVPSTVMALTAPGSAGSSSSEPSTVVQLSLAVGLGFLAGPILGLAQWFALRRLLARAGRWLWANALAWAVGMPLIFAGMDVVPWESHPSVIALSVYAVCGAAGAVVGAIHGRVLVQLLASSRHADHAG